MNIYGRAFKVQPYSINSHWYFVDLQRLLDGVSDGLIYDWFTEQGTPPVYITPAYVINGLLSRNRREYFNQKSSPRSVMLDTRTLLCQIQLTGQGFAVVHHRPTTYNLTIPPFVAKLRVKKTMNPVASPVPTDSPIVADVPPAGDNESDSSGSDDMADESRSDGEPHSGDRFGSDISHGDPMDE